MIAMRIARQRRVVRLAALAVMVLVMTLSRSMSAHADEILAGETRMVYGSAADTISFEAPSAGVVTAHINSLPWPVPLDALSFSVTTASDTLASWSSDGPLTSGYTETFDVGGAGTYFAHVMATAGASSLNLGLYGVMLTFTPSAVPLPTAAGLLLSGLFILWALRGTISASPRNESVMYPA